MSRIDGERRGDAVMQDGSVILEQADGCAVPVVAFVGWSGSGKTRFAEQVVGALCDLGVAVGVIKHHGHDDSPLDAAGKDSWRYAQAGAVPVIVSGASEYLVSRRVQRERSLAELVAEIAPECQLIVVEGYRQQAGHIIEFMREGHRAQRIIAADDQRLLAMVTDSAEAAAEMAAVDKPCFDLYDVGAVARYIVEWAEL